MTHPFERILDVTCLRRGFLQIGAAGLAGLSLSNALRRSAAASPDAPAAKARNVIQVFLTGGASTIDMWDMKPTAPVNIRGEFQPRDTSVAGVQICEHMPKLATALNQVTLVRSMAHTIAEHTQGAAYVMTGNRPSPAGEYASLGSLAANVLTPSAGTPPYITLGSVPSAGTADLGSAFNPLALSTDERPRGNSAQDRIGLPEGFTVTDLERRQHVLERLEERRQRFGHTELTKQLDRYQQQAFDILRSDKINKALDFESETPEIRERYGRSFFGRSALSARRLIEAGARFVTIGFGDWDTHNNNFTRLRTTLLPQLDQGLASLLKDLEERGLLNETIVYCTGEFGRTPVVNNTTGRDHWARSMTALLAGGGFRRGFVYGATDDQGGEPTDNACTPDDVSASVFQQLGFAPTHAVTDKTGRPTALFRNGHNMEALVQ